MNTIPMAGLGLAGLGIILSSVAGAADDCDRRVDRSTLPAPAQLEAEGPGEVLIDGGPGSAPVSTAPDGQFERPGNTLVVRLNQLPPTAAGDAGETGTQVEEDGCE